MTNDKDLSDPDQLDERIIQYLSGDLKRIAEIAGLEAAMKIAREFRGVHIYVPGLDEFERVLRDERIRQEYDGGESTRKLARRYKLTQRHVRRILNSPSVSVHPLINELLGGGH